MPPKQSGVAAAGSRAPRRRRYRTRVTRGERLDAEKRTMQAMNSARGAALNVERQLKSGYTRAKGRNGSNGAEGTYRFSKGSSRLFVRSAGKKVHGLDLYYVQGSNVQTAILARREAGGTYAVSRRLTPAMLATIVKTSHYTSNRQNSRGSWSADGGVPLYTMFNTDKIQNVRGQTRTVPRYSPFDSENRWVTDPRFPRALTSNEKMKLVLPDPEPLLCPDEKLDLRDQDSCFVRGMRPRLAPALARLKEPGLDACAASKTADLQPHQRSVFNLARTMAARTPEQLGGNRGLLCWHNTGSGKTVTSLGIVLAFWNSPRNIVLATTPANEADNNLSKYALNLFCFFPEYVAAVFKSPATPYPPPPWTLGSAPLKAWCSSKDNIKPLTNRVRTYTFTTLASELCLPKEGALGRSNPVGPKLLQGSGAPACGCGRGRGAGGSGNNGGGKTVGSVLIMDEVQSLFTPDPKFSRAAKFLVPLLTSEEYRRKMFVFALTATPGNKVADMIDVLNFVRPTGSPAFSKDDAKSPDKFRGLVSYVDIRSDLTRYGQKVVKNVFVEMSPRYYAGFLKSISIRDADLDYARLEKVSKEAGFLIKQRTAGNFLIKSALGGIYTDAELAAFRGSRPVPRVVDLGGNQLRVLSDKLMGVLQNATSMPGKQYVWVASLTTAKVAMAALEKMGFGQVQAKDYSKGRDAKGKTVYTSKIQAKGNRFILYKKGTANGQQLDEDILTAFAQTFSNRDNDSGDKVKIMLATETYYQGLDMRALQGVHLADALFNATADKQAVGRALRLCGHSGAPTKRVAVYRYFSTPPAKFDASNVAGRAKGGAAKKALAGLGPVDKRLRGLPAPDAFKGIRMPEGQNAPRVPPGVNSYVYADAARRQQPVDVFELGLKAFAVDCPLFKDAYHAAEPFQCGVKPSPAAAAAAMQQKNKKTQGGGGGFLSKLFGGGKPNRPANRPSAPPMPVALASKMGYGPPPSTSRPGASAPPMPASLALKMGYGLRPNYPTKTATRRNLPPPSVLRRDYPTKTVSRAPPPAARLNGKGRVVVTNSSVFFRGGAAAAGTRTPQPPPLRPTTSSPVSAAANAARRRQQQLLRDAEAGAARIRAQQRLDQQRRQMQRRR